MWRRRIDPNPWMPSARVSFFKTQNYLWKVLYTNPPLYRPVYYNRNGQRVAVGLVGGSFPSHIIKVLNFLNISLASSERTAAPRALAQRSGTTRATFRQVTTRLLPFSITISLHSCARKETSLTTPKFCSRPHSLNEWDVYGVTQLRHLINDCGDWFIITFLSPHSSGVPGGHARFPVGTMLPIRRRSIRKQILRVRSLIRTFWTIEIDELLWRRWVPYTRAPNKCELNCMPKGERFYYRHRRKVIDGTKCDEQEGTDVCVAGQCLVFTPLDVLSSNYGR